MRKTFVIALLLAVLLISGTAWASKHGDGQYWIFGAGYLSCGKWTEDAKKEGPSDWQHRHWILGYLTAYSLWVEDGLGPVSNGDGFGSLAWIDNYCQENPLEKIGDAAEKLIFAIKDK